MKYLLWIGFLAGCGQQARIDLLEQQLATVTAERDNLRQQLDSVKRQLDATKAELKLRGKP